VVHENVEAPQGPCDLQCHWIDIVLARYVADDAVRAAQLVRSTSDFVGVAGHERDAGATAEQLGDQRAAEARGAAGDGGAEVFERWMGHERLLFLPDR